MITSRMSDKEIIAEMKKDIPDVRNKFVARVNTKRLIVKADTFPVFSDPQVITSKRKNKWIVIFKADSKNDRKDSGHKLILVCTANFPEGVHAFMITKPYPDYIWEWGLAVFYPHFFARYRKRFEVNKTGMDLRKHFFRKNHDFFCDFQQNTGQRTVSPGRKVYGTSEEGVGLGVIRSEYAISFKTFITFEMARGEQVDNFAETESHRYAVTDSFRTLRVLKAFFPFLRRKILKG